MSYKSASFRLQAQAEPVEAKYHPQVQQLQELFPDFSVDDLQSILAEVNGDIELAVIRISEGHAEQWGSVKRKKDNKTSTAAHSKDPSISRDRQDSRGARGGRGGRGGATRGGSSSRGGRGAARGVNGRTPRPHTPKGSSPAPELADKEFTPAATDIPAAPADGISQESISPHQGWHSDHSAAEATPNAGWSNAPTWGVDASTAVTKATTASTPQKATKLPATSKLSWAQVARQQEKPPIQSPPAPPALPAPLVPELTEPAPVHAFDEPRNDGWEEPTTVQPPTWDDVPLVKPPPDDTWSSSAHPQPDSQGELPDSTPEEEPVPSISLPYETLQLPEQPSIAPPPSKSPSSVSLRSSATSHRNKYNKSIDQPVVMPSSSLSSGLEKVGMQFGSLSIGGDLFDASPVEPPAVDVVPQEPKESPQQPIQALPPVTPQTPTQDAAPITSPVHTTATTSPSISSSTPQYVSAPGPVTSAPVSASVSAPTTITAPVQPSQSPLTPSISSISSSVSQPVTSSNSQLLSQPQSQQPTQPQQLPSQVPLHSSLATPLQPQTTAQLSYPPHQVPTQHQFAHLGFPTHLSDTTVQQPSQTASQIQTQQPQQPASATYFRQADAPYFHAPTPPAGSQEYAVGVFGGQIGQQLPAQASHLAGFGSGDYGYEGQRGFYDYAQSPAFSGGRNVLSHDDVKSLPTSNQLPSASVNVLPPSSSQSTQLPPPQGSGAPQPSAAQGPQQSYPPHAMPYYYPYPQNHQYYGSPYNSGYGVPQTFVKYPTMFQPPPAQGTGAGKQGNVQQDHYGRSLYGSQHQQHQHQPGYDELYPHQQHHAPGVGSLGGEYKHPQLYGNQGIQGFMGLGQASNASSGPTLGQRTGGASPEAAYKPYSQNVGVKDGTPGVGGVGVGQSQGGRAGVQQGHGQGGGFYGGGANRFASSAGGTGPHGQHQQHQHQPGAQQGSAPQGHVNVGYPQGNADGNFYQYPRQQQFWQ
ncbi:hypothetical protein V8B97DRAFT_1876359 [Scleroderma yunnanense]